MHADDKLLMFAKIQNVVYSLPWFFPRDAALMIKALLIGTDSSRLGHASWKNSSSVFQQKFLQSLNPLELEARLPVAPYIPEIRSATDSSHFETNLLDYDDVYDEDTESILSGTKAW